MSHIWVGAYISENLVELANIFIRCNRGKREKLDAKEKTETEKWKETKNIGAKRNDKSCMYNF
jgi:hypothetical protein